MSLNLLAQPDEMEKNEKRSEVRAMRVAYMTSQMNLSPEESQQFWPINNQFESQRKKIMAPVKKQERELIKKGIEKASDEELMKMMNDKMEARSKLIELEKEYQKRYLDIITVQQLATYHLAEKRFKKMLIRKMREERGRNGNHK